jgi:uncharacterized glyoxalase superfamily protein PhnB
MMANQQVVPMVHVVDVRAAIKWYELVGFTVLTTFEDDGDMTFALLAYGDSQVMLSEGGQPSEVDRREVDLFIRTADVEGHFQRLKDRVEIRDGLDNTSHGTREFVVRDSKQILARIWTTY